MGKGYIIIDLPERCPDCPLHKEEKGLDWCGLKVNPWATKYTRPHWCPIKPLPESETTEK